MFKITCEECHIGRYQPIVTPYVCWLDDGIMVVPNVPAYACDICRHIDYDANFMRNVRYLLDHLTHDQQVVGTKLQPTVNYVNWQPARGSR